MERCRVSNCPCAGRWQDKWHRWVCLQRGSGFCFLKCLACGWKWKSRTKYARRLPNWVERSRSGMTDEMILSRLLAGNLRIDPVTAVVTSELCGLRVLTQFPSQHGEDGYRFVKINWQGKQKRISVHRLQWMAYSEEIILEGYDVHHKRSPPRPHLKPNSLANLELVESLINQSVGCSPGWEDGVPF